MNEWLKQQNTNNKLKSKQLGMEKGEGCVIFMQVNQNDLSMVK